MRSSFIEINSARGPFSRAQRCMRPDPNEFRIQMPLSMGAVPAALAGYRRGSKGKNLRQKHGETAATLGTTRLQSRGREFSPRLVISDAADVGKRNQKLSA